jgi:Domain of unknown function (DUF4397)
MKYLKIIIPGLGIIALSCIFLSCDKKTPLLATNVPNLPGSATVQVFSATLKAARNYIYVDGNPVSGATLAYSAVFPATAYSFKIEPGSRTILIKDTLAATTQVPLTFSQNFEAGKSYTIFTYDTITAAKQSTVLNDIVIPKDTTARLRFANFIYSPNALANVDVYSFRRIPGTPTYQTTAVWNNASMGVPVFTGSTPVFTNVATNQVTAFVPYAAGITDTLYVFATGTTSPLLAKGLVSSLIQTRSYTSTYNGSYRGNLAARLVTTFASY